MLQIEKVPALKKVSTDDHEAFVTTVSALKNYYQELRENGVFNEDLKTGSYVDENTSFQSIDDNMIDDFLEAQDKIITLVIVLVDFNGMNDILLDLATLKPNDWAINALKDYEPDFYQKCVDLQKYAKQIETIL